MLAPLPCPPATRLSRTISLALAAALAPPALALAQPSQGGPAAATAPAASASASAPASAELVVPAPTTQVTVGGYIEAFYQWNFNRPSNGVTAYRAYDTRHNTFTLANAVLDTTLARGPISGRLALQFGLVPESSYLAEPVSDGGGSTGTANKDTWKYLQQANVGYKAPLGEGLLLEAGLFLSPVGVEGIAVKDNFTWSRANTFNGLPFYHTGARATYPLTGKLSATAAVYNGWNSMVDNNKEKSVSASLVYASGDRITLNLLYFGGVERSAGAPEGRPWRHLVDAYIAARPVERLRFYVQTDGGMERTTFGTTSWYDGAAAAQVQLATFLYAAARGDYFREHVASSDKGSASPIFWPGKWVSSQTATLDARPADNASIRLEFRHDQAGGPTYFKGQVAADKTPTSKTQNTLTVGATAWF